MSGPYHKGSSLGRGSATTVYEGHDQPLGRPVAIKELAEPYASNDAFVRAFLAEASRVSAVAHPNVLTIYAVDSSHEPPRLIMELADGGTLRQTMARGPGQPAQAVQVLRQVLPGLAALHRAGVIHRDVKPENIFLCKGIFKIGDFGVTALADGRTLPFISPKYVAPEGLQASSRLGPSSDLYSLGLTIYEFLLGETKFRQVVDDLLRDSRAEGSNGEDPQPWFRLHLGPDELPPLHTVLHNFSEGLSQVLRRMMRKEPTARYASCDEALAALHEVRDIPSDPTVTIQVPRTRRQGRRWLWITVAAVWLIALAFGTWMMTRRKPAPKTVVKPPVVRPEPPPPPAQKEKPPPKPVPPEPFTLPRIPDASALADALLALRSSDAGLELDFEPSALTPRPQISADTPLRFRLSSNRPGFVALFAVSSDGSIALLYPNRSRTELIVGAVHLALPLEDDLRAGFRIVASPPFGRDLVFALTSTHPLPPPPAGDTPSPWITSYRFAPGGVESPALDFVRWVGRLRRSKPGETRLVSREMDVIPF